MDRAYGIGNPFSGLYVDIYKSNPWPGAVATGFKWNGGKNQYFFSYQG